MDCWSLSGPDSVFTVPCRNWKYLAIMLKVVRNLLLLSIPYCLRLREHAMQNSPKCETNKRYTFRSDFVFLRIWVCLVPPPPFFGLSVFFGTGLGGWEVFSNLCLLISIFPGRTQCFFIYPLTKHLFSMHFLPGTVLGAGNTIIDTSDLTLSSEGTTEWAQNEPQLWSRKERTCTCVGVCTPVQMGSFPSLPGFPTTSPRPGPMPVKWELAQRTQVREKKGHSLGILQRNQEA